MNLIRNYEKIKQILLVIWNNEFEGDDIIITGARFTRRKDYPDTVEGRLKAIEQHKARLYIGILEDDWDDVWFCEFCHRTFLSREEAETHEVSCPERYE